MENCRRSEPGAVAAAGMSVVASSFPYASHPGVGLPPTPFLWSSRLSREQRVGDPARAPRHRTRSAAKELAVVLDLCRKAHHSLLSLTGVDEPWLCHRLLPCLGSLSLTSSISSLTTPTPSSAFFLFTSPVVGVKSFMPGPAQAPARMDPPRRPPLHLRWIRRCRGLLGRIHRCCDLPGSIRRPFDRIASSRLDPSLSWPSRPYPPLPLLFCRGRGHHDRRRSVRCRRPPWQGSSTSERSKKQEGRPAGALLLSPSPIVDARTSTPPEEQATTACLSANSVSWGYRLLGVYTGLYSSCNIRTLMTLRLRGISTRRLLPSVSTPVSSCEVPPLRLRGDVRLCVCE
jgi:hypothetical protein